MTRSIHPRRALLALAAALSLAAPSLGWAQAKL